MAKNTAMTKSQFIMFSSISQARRHIIRLIGLNKASRWELGLQRAGSLICPEGCPRRIIGEGGIWVDSYWMNNSELSQEKGRTFQVERATEERQSGKKEQGASGMWAWTPSLRHGGVGQSLEQQAGTGVLDGLHSVGDGKLKSYL